MTITRNRICALTSPAPAVRFGCLIPVEQHRPSLARGLPSLGPAAPVRALPAVLRLPAGAGGTRDRRGRGEHRGPSSLCRYRGRAPSAGTGAELPLPVPGGSGHREQEQKGSRSTSFAVDSRARSAQTRQNREGQRCSWSGRYRSHPVPGAWRQTPRAESEAAMLLHGPSGPQQLVPRVRGQITVTRTAVGDMVNHHGWAVLVTSLCISVTVCTWNREASPASCPQGTGTGVRCPRLHLDTVSVTLQHFLPT